LTVADSGNGDKVVVIGSGGTVTQADGNGGTTIAGSFNYLPGKRFVQEEIASYDNLAALNGNAVRESSVRPDLLFCFVFIFLFLGYRC
jgi:hypothetical protein